MTPQARNNREWLRHESPLLTSAIVVSQSRSVLCRRSVTTPWYPYTLSGDFCPGSINALVYSPSAEQHAKMICCRTPQVLSVPPPNGRRRAWRLVQVGCGEGKCGRKGKYHCRMRGQDDSKSVNANPSM